MAWEAVETSPGIKDMVHGHARVVKPATTPMPSFIYNAQKMSLWILLMINYMYKDALSSTGLLSSVCLL